MTHTLRTFSPQVSAALDMVGAAAGESGIFSTSLAADYGLGDEVLRRLVSAGVVTRLARGRYITTDPSLGPKDLHARRARAHVKNYGGRAVASHLSALLIRRLPAFNSDIDTVHLTYRESATRRARAGLIVHSADASTRGDVLAPGAEAVSVPFAIAQTGLLSGTLAALVAGDAALHRALTDRAAIRAALDTYSGRPGVKAVSAIVTHLDGLAESPPESLARLALVMLGFAVTPQLEIRTEGRLFRVDLALEKERLIIEVDGRLKYESSNAAEAADAVMAEKWRESALLRAGWRVIRLTWQQIVTPDGRLRLDNILAIVNAALGRAVA